MLKRVFLLCKRAQDIFGNRNLIAVNAAILWMFPLLKHMMLEYHPKKWWKISDRVFFFFFKVFRVVNLVNPDKEQRSKT